MKVVTIDVPALGNRCHLVHDGRVAVVIDPPRGTREVERAAELEQVEIVAVADTHVHNDYLSGALGLARRHGADYLLAADEPVEFERVGVRHGDVLRYGGIEVEVLATPGHTRHHQSYLAEMAGETPALFTGGSLLHGTVGRTDLVDPRLAGRLAEAQWTSARLQAQLHPTTAVHPTHGFGSFCAAGVATATDGIPTIGDHLATHPALTTEREAFVTDLVAGFGPIPAHYAHMAPLNRKGAGSASPRPARPATAEQVSDAVLAGTWVIDLRDRAAYAGGHLPGTVSVEYGRQFATYVGWLVPWGDDIVLLTDSPTLLEPALRDLADIGIDGVTARVLGADDLATASYRRADWADYLAAGEPPVVVDVRNRDEWERGHLPGALHLPVQDVEVAGTRLPSGELWVHCQSGYRAGIASSLLHRMGRDVVHVDDSWERVRELAIQTTPAAAA
jgi:glyoxylase-like metal-dependent hydrolase (beta-lactamase superfamily II)/rhodanese-related sulfurtransferase